MNEARQDSLRNLNIALSLINGRDVEKDMASIMVSLEGMVATILVVVMRGDHRKAVAMLNEGLVPGVEQRIALGASRNSTRSNKGTQP